MRGKLYVPGGGGGGISSPHLGPAEGLGLCSKSVSGLYAEIQYQHSIVKFSGDCADVLQNLCSVQNYLL